ncbi:hypothetical protein BKA69DRAFT_1055032 [Paraphysoderma sedebokerense]|nr:hypothetical protein BKA69DRAFT_1055032 [Paraphysoderma sedebokerense]
MKATPVFLLLAFCALHVSAQVNSAACVSKLSQNLVYGDFQYSYFTGNLPANSWYQTRGGNQRIQPTVQFSHKGGNPYTAAIFNLENTDNVVSYDLNFAPEDDVFRISGLYDIKAACNGKFEIILTTRSCSNGDRTVVLESIPLSWDWSSRTTLYKNNVMTNRDPRGVDLYFMNKGNGKAARGTLSFKLTCDSTPAAPNAVERRPTVMLANIRVTPYPAECEPKCGDNLLVNGDFQAQPILAGWTAEAWNYGAPAPSAAEVAAVASAETQNNVNANSNPGLRVRAQTFQFGQTFPVAPSASYEFSCDWFLGTNDEVMFQVNTPVYDQSSSGVDSEGPTFAAFHWDGRGLNSDGRWKRLISPFQTPNSPNYKQSALVFRGYSLANSSNPTAPPNVAILDNLRLIRTDCWSPGADYSPETYFAPVCDAPPDSNPENPNGNNPDPTQPTDNPTGTIGPKSTTSPNSGSRLHGSAGFVGAVVGAGVVANML